jgi:hypothetical protein
MQEFRGLRKSEKFYTLVSCCTYSARQAITLVVKVANAGGAHMILVILTVSLVLSAWVKFATLI